MSRAARVCYLYKVVDSLKVCQIVVSHVHTNAKVQASITPVDDLEVPELRKQHKQERTVSTTD